MSNNNLHTRFAITAIKRNKVRELAFQNTGRNHYLTRNEAEQRLKDLQSANTADRILEVIGKDLRVDEILCYSHGDSTRTVFGEG